MEKKSKYYALYRFVKGTNYKAEVGKDGVTKDDMRNLRNVIKIEDRSNEKAKEFDAVSFEATFIESEKNADIIDLNSNVEVIIEIAEEYEALHHAIDRLLPQQKELVTKIFFKGQQASDVAKELGVTKQAINERLSKIYARLKKYL